MNYRMTQEFKPPFRINTLIEEAGTLRVSIVSLEDLFIVRAKVDNLLGHKTCLSLYHHYIMLSHDFKNLTKR